ncbi:MAG: 16S rRNA (cytosine(1402)-N(4))-methyltransferase RsmH [Flavobacteriaceae bacterium]
MSKTNYHDPVLLQPSVAALITDPNGVYIDATFGSGGHSQAILKALSTQGRLFAFDQDQDAVENSIDDDRFMLIEANFRDLKRYLKLYAVNEVHGILADFGVSSHQFDAQQRGFSIRFDGPLDMRMDQKSEVDAKKIVNTYDQNALAELLKLYGEVKGAYRIAEHIVAQREQAPLLTTQALIEVIRPLVPERFLNKTLAQVFQAIRIEVNQELTVIKAFLKQSVEILVPQGRLVCISYHSLEDRLVKRFIREGKFVGEAEQDFFGNRSCPLKKVGKLIVPDAEEIQQNSRARSAKLRIAEKT